MSSSSPVDENKRPTSPTSEAAPSSKKAKASTKNFREWSANPGDKAPTFTVQCFFGKPNTPLPSRIKTATMDVLRDMLEKRGVSATGKKTELLERLQNALPYVTIEMDARECLQRLINAMLHYFGWDSTHLFNCKMPARGANQVGASKLCDEFGLDTSLLIRMGRISGNPNHPMYRDNGMLRHTQRKLEALGMTWADLQRACDNKDAPGKWRRLHGAAFEVRVPKNERSDPYDEFDDMAYGAHLSLKDLELRVGDTINLTYDFGDDWKFTLKIINVENDKDIIPEESLAHHRTRAKLVEKGNGKLPPQYRY